MYRKIELPMRYCIICNKSIIRNTKQGEKRISTTQYKKAKFCSLKCKGIWWSKNCKGKNNGNWKGGEQKIICKNCKKEFYVRFCFRKITKYCSKKCYIETINGTHLSSETEFKKGQNAGKKHPQWKGGKLIDKSGYILIYSPKHPFKNHQQYVREHRLVAEKCIGRYLTKLEIIHHINGIKDDNRPENLYLFSSNGKHIGYHITAIRKELKSNLYLIILFSNGNFSSILSLSA